MELFPRTRRILDDIARGRKSLRTTSACAENTQPLGPGVPLQRNYLRVRGEYSTSFCTASMISELPPRARRIPATLRGVHSSLGTTSACAENTCRAPTRGVGMGNYLRMRGKYTRRYGGVITTWELPPHARRILLDPAGTPGRGGTTSACAENTRHPPRSAQQPGNYLRMRGEYADEEYTISLIQELPPHARRILLDQV